MSDKPIEAPEVTTHASAGNGNKWLIGAAAAAVLAVGGYFAWANYGQDPSNMDVASNEASYGESADAPHAQPFASASNAENSSSSAAPQNQRAATANRRTAAARASNEIPEQTVGIIPVSATVNDSDEIIVEGARRPVWARTPNERRLSAVYPERALQRGREGEASVHCTVQENGALDCVRVSETPANAGFGNAALRVANMYRHAPQRWDGSNAIGSPVNLRVVFRMEDDNRRRG